MWIPDSFLFVWHSGFLAIEEKKYLKDAIIWQSNFLSFSLIGVYLFQFSWLESPWQSFFFLFIHPDEWMIHFWQFFVIIFIAQFRCLSECDAAAMNLTSILENSDLLYKLIWFFLLEKWFLFEKNKTFPH